MSEAVVVDLPFHSLLWLTLKALYRKPLFKTTMSAVLFCASFTWLLSFKAALILAGILLIHELGHAIVARAYGAKIANIIFLPFLGAVTSSQGRLSRYRQVIVELAGPATGILLGLLGFWAYHDTHRTAFAGAGAAAALYGLFNMIPFSILDGGQVFRNLRLSLGLRTGLTLSVLRFGIIGFVLIGMNLTFLFLGFVVYSSMNWSSWLTERRMIRTNTILPPYDYEDETLVTEVRQALRPMSRQETTVSVALSVLSIAALTAVFVVLVRQPGAYDYMKHLIHR